MQKWAKRGESDSWLGAPDDSIGLIYAAAVRSGARKTLFAHDLKLKLGNLAESQKQIFYLTKLEVKRDERYLEHEFSTPSQGILRSKAWMQ